MLDHIGYAVTDINRSTRFYRAALAPLSMPTPVAVRCPRSEGAL